MIDKNDNSRKLLIDFLDELAIEYIKPEQCNPFYTKIEKIYCLDNINRFKHFYSDIFSKIAEIKSAMSINGTDKDLAKLRSNIELLYVNYSIDKSKNDIKDCLKKLYDHISLEVARLDYNDSVFKVNIENSITEDVKKRIDRTVEESYNDLDKKVQVVYKQFKDSERNYITILGIFASFVVTFVGGLSFSSSVLNAISSISPYRLFVVILLLGFILLTICFSLYWFIAKIVNNVDIKNMKCIYITFTIGITVFLLVCMCLWCNGVVEKRNKKINNLVKSTYSEIIEFK